MKLKRRCVLVLFPLAILCSCAGPSTVGTPTATVLPDLTPSTTAEEDAFVAARKAMVERQIRARDIADERLLAAMEKVPRHWFIPKDYRGEAYADYPLPIGQGQTISQPYIVALMTELLMVQPEDKVLEIGTGSGYQAAILGELTRQVYTVEIIEVLSRRATQTLNELGYDFIQTKEDDGYYGWEEYAPYDAIIVTCAPDHVPQPLINQLKDGGRLIIPVGPPGFYQTLWLIERQGDQILSTNQGGVRFVPMLGER